VLGLPSSDRFGRRGLNVHWPFIDSGHWVRSSLPLLTKFHHGINSYCYRWSSHPAYNITVRYHVEQVRKAVEDAGEHGQLCEEDS
jgi:hypothetical protein